MDMGNCLEDIAACRKGPLPFTKTLNHKSGTWVRRRAGRVIAGLLGERLFLGELGGGGYSWFWGTTTQQQVDCAPLNNSVIKLYYEKQLAVFQMMW